MTKTFIKTVMAVSALALGLSLTGVAAEAHDRGDRTCGRHASYEHHKHHRHHWHHHFAHYGAGKAHAMMSHHSKKHVAKGGKAMSKPVAGVAKSQPQTTAVAPSKTDNKSISSASVKPAMTPGNGAPAVKAGDSKPSKS